MLPALTLPSNWSKILLYIGLLFILWNVVRFSVTFIWGYIRYFSDDYGSKVVDPFINGVHYPVSYWTDKGGRPYQEDRHQEIKGLGSHDSSLYAVFDGQITKYVVYCGIEI
jgi:hypothetical protein